LIQAQNLGKIFGKKWAVRGVSFDIKNGEIFALIGPNGAGKTTIIKLLTGLLSPTEGRAVVLGFDLSKDPISAKKTLGYLPDRGFLYERLTGREFLLFISSIREVGKPKALSRIDELSDEFNMGDYLDNLIESYSQGMRQRLLFASALLHEPHVLLIDEPFVGLDPIGIGLFKETLKRLSKRERAILVATHSLHTIEPIVDRIGFIKNGSLTAIKTKEEFISLEGGLEGFFLKEAKD